MTRCQLTFEMLLNAYEGRADAADIESVREHLAAGCASCRQSWAWLERVLSAARGMDNVPVPDWPVALATALFRERYVKQERPTLLALLTFDSRTLPRPASARGHQELARHLIYSSDDYDVEIWQEAISREAFYVIGQVLPRQDGSAIALESVALTDSKGDTIRITTEGGEFHFPAVAAGRYQVRFEMAEGVICLFDVIVGT
jgi:hypothetical protein